MGNLSTFDHMMEKKLMDLRCGYIGKVLSTNGVTAKVQPLGKIKDSAGETKDQAPVSDVPVACRYKIRKKTISHLISTSGATETLDIAIVEELKAGDLVACLCSDRNIEDARRGINSVPPAGRHSISDSIIVGILE